MKLGGKLELGLAVRSHFPARRQACPNIVRAARADGPQPFQYRRSPRHDAHAHTPAEVGQGILADRQPDRRTALQTRRRTCHDCLAAGQAVGRRHVDQAVPARKLAVRAAGTPLASPPPPTLADAGLGGAGLGRAGLRRAGGQGGPNVIQCRGPGLKP